MLCFHIRIGPVFLLFSGVQSAFNSICLLNPADDLVGDLLLLPKVEGLIQGIWESF